ncbi:hypothetical protein QEN19_003731 [Hanseniaspora menglaensis]
MSVSSMLTNTMLRNFKIHTIYYKISLRRSLIDMPHQKKHVIQDVLGMKTGKLHQVHLLPVNRSIAGHLLDNKELLNVELLEVEPEYIEKKLSEYIENLGILPNVGQKIGLTEMEETEVTKADADEFKNSLLLNMIEEDEKHVNKFLKDEILKEFKTARKIDSGFSVTRY